MPDPKSTAVKSWWQSLTGGRPDVAFLLVLVGSLNLPLLFGATTEPFIFSESSLSLKNGWQLLTHPFVHVSWYHLLLDSTAFFALYPSLMESKCSTRLSYLAGSALGSLLAALCFNPEISEIGFCGLSGVAHGITAIWSIEKLNSSSQNRTHQGIGALCLTLVLTKTAWELGTQTPFLGALHFDLMGTPILACHAGGALGGILAYRVRK